MIRASQSIKSPTVSLALATTTLGASIASIAYLYYKNHIASKNDTYSDEAIIKASRAFLKATFPAYDYMASVVKNSTRNKPLEITESFVAGMNQAIFDSKINTLI